jgi:hypothetical protein
VGFAPLAPMSDSETLHFSMVTAIVEWDSVLDGSLRKLSKTVSRGPGHREFHTDQHPHADGVRLSIVSLSPSIDSS